MRKLLFCPRRTVSDRTRHPVCIDGSAQDATVVVKKRDGHRHVHRSNRNVTVIKTERRRGYHHHHHARADRVVIVKKKRTPRASVTVRTN